MVLAVLVVLVVLNHNLPPRHETIIRLLAGKFGDFANENVRVHVAVVVNLGVV